MELYLKDKKVLITGATRGIGLAAAREFIREGAKVCITGRDEYRVETVIKSIRHEYPAADVMGYCGNLLNRDAMLDIHRVIEEKWQTIDVLIPNIGSGKPMTDDPLDIGEWNRLLQVNLLGGIELLQIFQDMLKADQGSIVMVSSIVAREVFGKSYAYAASKEAVLAATKYLAKDMASHGVRVNAVLPGNVIFEGGRWEELISLDEQGVRETIDSTVPMKRFGRPEEIAKAIVFLASDAASFITGTFLTVDGGQTSAII